MTSELKLFGDLLFQLWVSHEKPWAYSNGEATEIYRQIGDLYRSFERREELEAFIPSHSQPISNFASTKRFLYLNPCEGQPTFVPVLSLKCDFDRPQPEIRLRVGLFLRDQGEIRAIGLRFESPEGEDEGIHHYYHAQYITYFYDGAPLKGAPPWLPITQPAMALEADGPVGLLLSLLVSLYGVDHVGRLAVALTGDLRTYVQEFTPDHWLVNAGAGQLKYRTWKSSDRFRARTQVRHVGGAITSIDADTYRADDGRARHVD